MVCGLLTTIFLSISNLLPLTMPTLNTPYRSTKSQYACSISSSESARNRQLGILQAINTACALFPSPVASSTSAFTVPLPFLVV